MSKEQSSGRLHLFSLLLVWLSFFFLSCLLIIADVMHVYVRRAISPPSLASKILFGKVLLNWIPKTVVSKIIPWVISSNANISVYERARLGYEICSSAIPECFALPCPLYIIFDTFQRACCLKLLSSSSSSLLLFHYLRQISYVQLWRVPCNVEPTTETPVKTEPSIWKLRFHSWTCVPLIQRSVP